MTTVAPVVPVPSPTPKSCEFCEKQGLPLLLVRAAVAPAGSGAPLAHDLEIPLAATAAHYTTRLLRQGYVFLYDEARTTWQIYAVTPQGYLFKVPNKPGKYNVPGKFNCSTNGHREIASCVTISDPKNATRVWVGFSEVMWTQAVMNKHADESYRDMHMVQIDVKSIMAGKNGPNIRPIEQVSAVVAEYALNNETAKSIFNHSPFPPDPRFGTADQLQQECNKMALGKGKILTLPDPAAIAQELALKMHKNAFTFANHNSRRRQLIADQTIESIKRGVRFRNEQMQKEAGEMLIAQDNAEFPHLRWEKKTVEFHTKISNQTAEALKRAADSDWAKYEKKFNNVERRKWKENYLKQLEIFDSKFIAPLARNHVSWMQSTALRNYFECNFDENEAGSGVAYAHTLLNCTIATQDKQACARLYDSWLTGSPGDRHNLLMRALVINQQKVADAVHKVHVGDFDARQIPWDSILGIHKEAVEKFAGDAGNVGARIVVNFIGCFARVLGRIITFPDIIDGKMKYSAKSIIMNAGIIAKKPVVICKLTGSHAEFSALLGKHLKIASGLNIADDVMDVAVRKVINEKGITATRVQGQDVWMAMPNDKFDLPPAHLTTAEQQGAWLAKQINHPREVERLDMNKWKSFTNTNFKFSVIAALLQLVCLSKMATDRQKVLANQSKEESLRLFAALVAFGGTTVDIVGNMAAGRSAFSMGVPLATVSNYWLIVGRGAGAAAGVAMALFDIYHAYVEIRTGGDGVVIGAYIASAVVGALLTYVIFFGMAVMFIPILGLLVILLIGIGIWLESIKDNPIQDWLERCTWGNLIRERYKDLATEQAELIKALS